METFLYLDKELPRDLAHWKYPVLERWPVKAGLHLD
jgi:hypothetical protein